MSDIYKIVDPESGETQLVTSKEYVDLRLQRLEEALIQHEKEVDEAHTISSMFNSVPSLLDTVSIEEMISPTIDQVRAEDVKTDSEHKFISQSQLEAFRNKASINEVRAIINNEANNLKQQFNTMYTNLLNKPNAVKDLKAIFSLLDTSGDYKKLIELLENALTEEDLREHTDDDTKHVNSVDRKALSILITLIKDGTLDKVKNLSLDYCANSLNSNNLNNKSYDQVRAIGPYEQVYGINGSSGEDYRAGHMFSSDQDLLSEITHEDLCNTTGKVFFLKGAYYISSLDLNRNKNKDSLIIEGAGSCTKFYLQSGTFNHVEVRDISIIADKECNINIGKYVTFNNVIFENMSINLDGTNRCKFTNCTFKNCKLTMKGTCIFNVIKDNVFDSTPIPKYIGSSNIIKDNIQF